MPSLTAAACALAPTSATVGSIPEAVTAATRSVASTARTLAPATVAVASSAVAVASATVATPARRSPTPAASIEGRPRPLGGAEVTVPQSGTWTPLTRKDAPLFARALMWRVPRACVGVHEY